MISLEVNGKKYDVEANPDVPLLWVIREHLGLTGTKYGCGKSLCGAYTLHIDGKAERSCQIPVRNAQGKRIITIEGISEDHPIKKATQVEVSPHLCLPTPAGRAPAGRQGRTTHFLSYQH